MKDARLTSVMKTRRVGAGISAAHSFQLVFSGEHASLLGTLTVPGQLCGFCFLELLFMLPIMVHSEHLYLYLSSA